MPNKWPAYLLQSPRGPPTRHISLLRPAFQHVKRSCSPSVALSESISPQRSFPAPSPARAPPELAPSPRRPSQLGPCRQVRGAPGAAAAPERQRGACRAGPAGRHRPAAYWTPASGSTPCLLSSAVELFHDPFITAQIHPACAGLCHTSLGLGIRTMVHTPTGRYSRAAPAPARFDALCMALGLSDGPSLQTYSAQPPQSPKIRLAPAGGVRKAPQRRSKLAATAALEHSMATPPRLAEQPHRRQPFAVGRRLQPLPPVWRPQRAAQPAARSTPSCDTVTSPNVRPTDPRQGSCYLGSAPGAGLSPRTLFGCGA